MTIRTGRLTYQPYLFAIALLTLLCKVAYSVSKQEQVFDSLLWAFAAIFVVSSLLYYFEIRTAPRKPTKSISANIKTGDVSDSEITGLAGPGVTEAKVEIATKDVKKSKLTGYEGKN